jgi:hypothetical protein
MKKTIRFEQNIINSNANDRIMTLRVLELHNGYPVMLYEIPLCNHQRVVDCVKYRFNFPHLN